MGRRPISEQSAYQCSAPVQLDEPSAVSIAAWSRSILSCSSTFEPVMYQVIICVLTEPVHDSVVPALSGCPSLDTSAPTCWHVMPRHAYVSSNASLTSVNAGFWPGYTPNFMLLSMVNADFGLQYATSGSTDALNTEPSAAFFTERSTATSPILYA